MEAVKVKKDRLSTEAYNNQLDNECDRLARAYVMAQIPKGLKAVEKAQSKYESKSLHAMFKQEARSNLEKSNIVEIGTRTSNISLADQDMQDKWHILKEQVEGFKFVGTDGTSYIGSCMIKKAK